MRGIVISKRNTWVIIRGDDKNTYRCDRRGYDQIEKLKVGIRIEFVPSNTPNGKRCASDVTILQYEKLSEEDIVFFKQRIQESIDKNGFFLCTDLPSLFRSRGLSDYKDYISGYEELITSYYSDLYIFKTKLSINGKEYPDVVIPCDGFNPPPGQKDYSDGVLTADEWLELSNLSENGDFEACLLSDTVHKYEYYELAKNDVRTIELLINCGMQMLNLTSNQPYLLNLFQKELIRANNTGGFKRTWKKEPVVYSHEAVEQLGNNTTEESDLFVENKESTRYPLEIIELCANTSLVSFKLPNEIKKIYNLIERLAKGTRPNNTIISLSERFELCFNEITPAAFLIRAAFAYKSNSSNVMRDTVSDYCKFIKALKKSKYKSDIDFDKQIYTFVKFLNIVSTNWYFQEFDRGVKINIFSVFVDCDYPDLLEKLPSIWSQYEDNEGSMLFNLLQNHTEWNQNEIKRFFDLKGNLLLFEKCCAWIWHKYRYSFTMPKNLIYLLSWILQEGGQEVLNEIIKQHYGKDFSKHNKDISLVSSLPEMVNSLDEDSSLYGLTCYTIKYVLPNLTKDDIPDNAQSIISNWVTIEEEFYERQLEKTDYSNDKLTLLSSLFTTFKMNPDRYIQLQKQYTSLLTQRLQESSVSATEYKCYLQKAFDDKAYDAFCELYDQYKIITGGQDPEYITQYIHSLFELQLYSRLIQVVLAYRYFSATEQEKYIIMAIIANFSKFGFSQNAMLLFNESFTLSDAIELLENNFEANNSGLIVSLMALYIKNDDLYKALYLNSIYSERAATGFAYLYYQLNSQYGRALNSCMDKEDHSNHYVVLENAFYCLSVDKLWEFILWSGRIPIHYYDDYHPTHIFDHFFKKILNNPKNNTAWIQQLEFMKSHREMNRRMICAATPIAMEQFGMPSSADLSELYLSVMDSKDLKDIPENFVYCVTRYIVLSNGNEEICSKLAELLTIKEINAKLIQTNYWHKYRFEEIKPFTEHCNEKLITSGNYSYYTLLTTLKGDLSSDELLNLMQFSVSKDLLISQLSKNYLDTQSRTDIHKLLSDPIWKNVTYREKSAHDILDLIYQDNDVLFEMYPHLFNDEAQILRFKQDCAKILTAFPDSKLFKEFDLECSPSSHKFVVLGFLSKIYYDEDVFGKYQYGYDFLIKSDIEQAFIEYTRSIYQAQLFYNSSYEYFYKQWRYHKLLILKAWHMQDDLNDADIKCIASENDQELFVSTPEYQNLKEQLIAFTEDTSLSFEQKRMLLYCIANGNIKEFLSNYSDALLRANDRIKNAVRQIVLTVDYRDINSSMFEFYLKKIKNRQMDDIRNIVACISETATCVIDQLLVESSDNKPYQLFESFAVKKKRMAECLSNVIKLDEDEFEQYADLLVPIAVSRQLSSKIIDYIRRLILTKSEKFSVRLKKFIPYLQMQGYNNAESQFNYLCALDLCMKNNIHALRQLIQDNSQLFVGLPLEWEEEAKKIKKYALSDGKEVFVPDTNIVFRTGLGVTYSNFSFLELIKSVYNKSDALNENESDKKIREELTVLDSNISSDDDSSYEVKQIEVALHALEASSVLSIEEKLEIIFNIYEQCNISRKYKESLSQCFISIFRELSIDSWLRYYSLICNLLSENSKQAEAEEIKSICASILEYCPTILNGEECSTEKALECYKTLIYPGKTNCGIALNNAINTKKNQLKSLTKLSICIENEEVINDGRIYYVIKNIGDSVVNVADECTINITVYTDSGEPYPIFSGIDNIGELRRDWITGKAEDITKYISDNGKFKIGQMITVKVELWMKSKLISSDVKTLNVSDIAPHNDIPLFGCYDVGHAVSSLDEYKLIGREEAKENLKGYIPKGKTVIYGPSRIGKTSILNWVRNEMAQEAGNVITILYGGENVGKDIDYKISFVDQCSDVPYSDDNDMTEYLLIQTITNALSQGEEERVTFPRSTPFTEEIRQEIIKAAYGNGATPVPAVAKRYKAINKVLKDAGLQLWILLDEFQYVVKNWKLKNEYPFSLACNELNDKSNIKLIVCGSDDLLKHMILEDESFWQNLFWENQVKVGPLDDESFKSMITDEPKFLRTGLHYSKQAQEALFEYTGGIALYGKELCNQVLEQVRENKNGFDCRNTIYASDIAFAAQKLLNDQDKEKNNENAKGIRRIYNAVTKGLEDDDMQYIKYIAFWLKKHPENNSFPLSAFTNRKLRNKNALTKLLEIADARMILEEIKDEFGEVSQYDFRTLFYYNAFLGSISSIYEIENSIFDLEAEKEEQSIVPFEQRSIKDILEELETRSYTNSEAEEFKAGLPEMLRNGAPVMNIGDGGKVVYGDDNSQNITIENMIVNKISNSVVGLSDLLDNKPLHGVLDTDKVKNYLNSIPRLELLPSGTVISSDDELAIYDTDNYVETVEEGVQKAVKTKAKYENIKCWAEEQRDRLEKLGVSDVDYVLSLPDKESNSILIALYLRCLFDDVVELSSISIIDYAPVTIMMCKTIERILKEKHLPLYLDPSIWKYKVKSFSDNTNVKRIVITFNDPTTIGTFTTALFAMFTPSVNDPEKDLKDEIREAFVAHTSANSRKWKSYLFNLVEAKNIRNKTAHIDTVTQEDCNDFFELFFKSNLLKNTKEFVE